MSARRYGKLKRSQSDVSPTKAHKRKKVSLSPPMKRSYTAGATALAKAGEVPQSHKILPARFDPANKSYK